MSFKKRKPNRSSKRSKQTKPVPPKVDRTTRSPYEYEEECATEVAEHHETELEVSADRFLLVKEIAERCGVGDTAVRKWNREGKLQLRKLFGSTGPYGMPESQFIRLIRGEEGQIS